MCVCENCCRNNSIMEFEKIIEALKSLQLDHLYLNNFKEKKSGDSFIQFYIDNENEFMADALAKLIPENEHRRNFIAAFKQPLKREPNRLDSSRIYRNTGCPVEVPNIQNKTNKNTGCSIEKPNFTERSAIYRNTGCPVDESPNIPGPSSPFKSIRGPTVELPKPPGASSIKKHTGSPSNANIPARSVLQRPDKDIVLKASIIVASDYYENEMIKEMASHSNQFIPHAEFQELSSKTTKAALARCLREHDNLSRDQQEGILKAMNKIEKRYHEKNWLRAPQDSVAIGIDLGTTYSCVAVCRGGEVTIIPNQDRSNTTPSCIAFDENGDVVVGKMAKYDNHFVSRDTCFDAKRLIGRNFSDPEVQADIQWWPFKVVQMDEDGEDTPKIQIRGKTYFPEQISAWVLHHMKQTAEDFLGQKVMNAVITVPAYFNNGQRQATKDAGVIAGLNILKIINEPTAAAIAYQHKLNRKYGPLKKVLIFDLGGGTLDVVIITICEGNITVKAVGGDTHLGGQDFDNELVKHCISKFNEEHSSDLGTQSDDPTSRALRRIRRLCEEQKCHLSAARRVTISIDAVYGGLDLNVRVTRQEFESLNQAKFEKCMEIVSSVVNNSEFEKGDIDDVVLVGGSTAIPKIQKMLSHLFDGRSLNKSLNPEEAVAYGAAIQAAIINSKTQAGPDVRKHIKKIRDVTPFSLGIEVYDRNSMSVFIPKNTLIPCKHLEILRTVSHNQTEIVIKVYEGEEPVAVHNHLLGTFKVENIPAAKMGEERIETAMEINEDGILHITALVTSNRSFGRLTISSLQGRLSNQQIQELKLKDNS